MRRRPRDLAEVNGWPVRLMRYRAEEWPGASDPECAYWEAVSDYNDLNPENPLEAVERGPDEPWHPERI